MWRELGRDYGDFYTGTKEETPDYSQGAACGLPRQLPTLPGNAGMRIP
jgi:hypothetical protein